METLKMVQLFYELIETAHPIFKNDERPITDTVLRLLNDSYYSSLTELCELQTFPLTTAKTGGNLQLLRNLHIMEVALINPVTATMYEVDLVSLKADLAYFVRGELIIQRTALPELTSDTAVNLKPISAREVESMVPTAYNKPIIREPGISYNDGKMYVYVDVYTTVSSLNLYYIKQPDPLSMNVSSECLFEPEAICHTVVKKAVDMFIQSKAAFIKSKQEDKK